MKITSGLTTATEQLPFCRASIEKAFPLVKHISVFQSKGTLIGTSKPRKSFPKFPQVVLVDSMYAASSPSCSKKRCRDGQEMILTGYSYSYAKFMHFFVFDIGSTVNYNKIIASLDIQRGLSGAFKDFG